ncbi:Mn2+/Fe2+ transporter, NRAMP family [Actinoalloteichus hymeniacidonis]|uniref:Mn2+/Fe2+ transporter, NRAMP family n=2 Tax=Actinoalloteichus hymeniacidonis TaxID=340345 RepID=A0AAC9HLT8_9PSEU|nr:Mn2+/Fe2+ transporter, NRAMP family [Actinoalloteichus hymeniacidonis]
MAAATGVGAGDLVATLVAGSRFGYTLFWAVIVGTIFKIALAEATGRWHVTSGRTILSGWRQLGRWALGYFGIYAAIWGFVYGATAMSASALPLNALFPVLDVRYWGIICGLLGLVIVWFGRYAVLERIMTIFVGIMFVTVVGTAILVVPNMTALTAGVAPVLPEGSLIYVLGLIGGVGGTITMASYGYWTMAKGWRTPKWLGMMRFDNIVGYVTTGVFVASMLIVGAELLRGFDIQSGDGGLLTLADVLAADYGQWARIPFLVGFFAVAFSSVIGVWNGVSLLVSDWWRVWRLRKHESEKVDDEQHYDQFAGPKTKMYKGYLLWLTFPPMALLFLDQPFQLVIVYGVLGALFMPFLAGTLMVLLNSKKLDKQYRSRWLSNTLLGICVLLFAVIAINQLIGIFTG